MGIKKYDVVVIGSGGGTKISTPASKLGYRAAIIEKDRLGGTCLNRGCIPSKMLIHAAEVAHTLAEADRYQIHPKGFNVDFPTLVNRVRDTIDEESDSILPGYRDNPNLHFYHGKARFTGERTLQVRDETIYGDKVYIATGSRPFVPPIPGLAETPFLTSQEALRLTTQPKSLLVLGGGYIACELAFFFAALGTQVQVAARSRLLKFEDKEIREHFEEAFSKRCQVNLHHQPVGVAYQDQQFTVTFQTPDGERRLQAEHLLVATGVIPNSDGLGLASAGVETHAGGFIMVDQHLRTTASNVWALGDVVGNYFFRHSVNLEGEYLFRTTIESPVYEPIDYGAMPHAVFTSPQVAGVGATEEELRKKGTDYVVGLRKFAASAMGMALRSEEGMVKLLVEKGTRKILGCHIVGHEASVLIHQVITLMQMAGTLDDLLATIYIHPALNEIVRNAARDAREKLAKRIPA